MLILLKIPSCLPPRFREQLISERFSQASGDPPGFTSVGATLRLLGASSFSDSLVSRLPSTLPLTELGPLTTPAIGVCGGVVHGRLEKDEFAAATPGTVPRDGVGLLVIVPDWVATDEVEFDLVGLGGRIADCWVLGVVLRTGVGAGECKHTKPGGGCFSTKGGALLAIGVGVGVACADETVDMAGDG